MYTNLLPGIYLDVRIHLALPVSNQYMPSHCKLPVAPPCAQPPFIQVHPIVGLQKKVRTFHTPNCDGAKWEIILHPCVTDPALTSQTEKGV
jgi:hypothetical protein